MEENQQRYSDSVWKTLFNKIVYFFFPLFQLIFIAIIIVHCSWKLISQEKDYSETWNDLGRGCVPMTKEQCWCIWLIRLLLSYIWACDIYGMTFLSEPTEFGVWWQHRSELHVCWKTNQWVRKSKPKANDTVQDIHKMHCFI